ncbi:MAG: ATP-grasp domain-containing protein [Cellulosilyticaceae bacterium]
MIKGWLVYRKEDLAINQVFAKALVAYGLQEGLAIELLVLEELQIGLSGGNLVVWDQDGVKKQPEFVINRTRSSQFGYQLEQMGSRVFNSSKVSELCNHKGKTHQFVSRLGIRSVDTVFFDKSYMKIEECHLGYPVVIKSPTGHGGKQVYLAQSVEEAHQILRQMDEDEIVIQAVCSQVGKDVRVFVLGEEIIGAICRTSDTDFRSNYSLGGLAACYQLSNKQKSLVKQIVEVLDCDYVGIDFMLDHNEEFVFNEIEDVVGSRTLYQYGNIDVAKCYMEYIAKKLRSVK